MSKTYYEILGIDKNASQDDIKKAFRKLSKKYHPDLAEDKKAAEEKFKEISAAYDVLSDEEKRRRYDMLGHDNYVNGGASAGGSGFGGFEGFSGFEGFGGEFHGGFGGFEDIFSSFFGGGARVNTKGEDIHLGIRLTLEEIDKGIQKEFKYKRHAEKGVEEVTKTISIPQGASDGKSYIIRQGGHFGQAYQNIPGQYGDLYITVTEIPHKDFVRVSQIDLKYTLKLDPVDAILGTTAKIPILNGDPKEIKIPSGTPNGKIMKLSGKGLHYKGGHVGDLYIAIEIEIPKTVKKEEKKLFEQIRELREGKKPESSKSEKKDKSA